MRSVGTENEDKVNDDDDGGASKKPPEPPDNCCMTGCANCVWLKYADELTEYYKDGGVLADEAIDSIKDPSLKAFLKMQQKMNSNN